MASRLGKLNRKGSKKSQDVGVAILNGKPALQVNWGGRIYGAPLTLVGSSNIKEALNIGDIRASGNIIFDIGSKLINNSNRVLMTGGLTYSGDFNMALGDIHTLSSLVVSGTNHTNNTAVGNAALKSIVNSKLNVAIGDYAMANVGKSSDEPYTDCQYNTAVGSGAMQMRGYHPQGINNTAIGAFSMLYAEQKADADGATPRTVDSNTCVGVQSGFYVKGKDNTYIGRDAGYGHPSAVANLGNTGDYNTAIGSSSLVSVGSSDASVAGGSGNVSIGYAAGTEVTTGSDNVIIGNDAGDTITTGSDNICIGAGSDTSASGASGQVAIGHDISCTADNTTVIGNTSIILDASGDITLSADGGNVKMDDGTVEIFDFNTDSPELTIYDDADTDGDRDYFKITVGAAGATEISTNDDDGNAADLTIDPDGDIVLTPNDDVHVNNTITLYNGANGTPHIKIMSPLDTGDYSQLSTTTHGATTLTTVDDAATAAHLTFTIDGNVEVDSAGDITLDADGDQVSMKFGGTAGQIDFTNANSGDGIIQQKVDAKDLVIQQYDGNEVIRFTDGQDVNIQHQKKLYLDGGGDSYLSHSAADTVRHVVGGDILIQLTENGSEGNIVNFTTSAAGFTQHEPTYNASDTEVNFHTSGNKAFCTFGAGNITDLNLNFPAISGNFILLLKQDGTGSREVSNWKTFDQAGGNESTVVWAGGSAPTLTTTANKLDILSFYWDNDNHKAYGVASLNF